MLIGGIEAGGTKMVCGIGDEKGNLIERVSFPTRQPVETFHDMIGYFKKHEIQALGIGCFGPIDLDRKSETYGYITTTLKLGWENCNIVGVMKDALQIPIGFDTDVNGAVLGEASWGAAKDCDTAIYITIGTGVGVGVYVNGGLLHGLIHPEAGHALLSKHPEDHYKGRCPYHENCVEALASGPAIMERWGVPAVQLADRKEVWEIESYYVAQAITNYILTYSPQKVILWGGVMHQEQMFPMVRKKVQKMLNGYLKHTMIEEQIENYIVSPELGENAGILGAIRLGMLELERR